MYYHGTDVGGLKELIPSKSNEGSYVYLAKEKERVYPYLVNPLQKFWDEKCGSPQPRVRMRFARFGREDGKMVIKELWPNFFLDTYKGQKAYIYYFDDVPHVKELPRDGVYGVSEPLKTQQVEEINDVYEEFVKLDKLGVIKFEKFEDLSQQTIDEIKKLCIDMYLEFNFKVFRTYLEEKCPYVKEYLENSNKN